MLYLAIVKFSRSLYILASQKTRKQLPQRSFSRRHEVIQKISSKQHSFYRHKTALSSAKKVQWTYQRLNP